MSEDIYADLAGAVIGIPAEDVGPVARSHAKQAFWEAFRRVGELPENLPVTELVTLLHELSREGALEGISAVIQARVAMVRGQVPVPGGDLVAAAMWHQATEAVRPRLERLALAAAILTIELDAEALRHA